MILGIDASNIRAGGGITHLSEFLRYAQPDAFGFQKVMVWAGAKTLSRLCDHSLLKKVHVTLLDAKLPQRLWWQHYVLPKLLKENNCALLLSPGGILPRRISVPTVTMSRNMLPFMLEEARRYRLLPKRFRLKLIQFAQKKSFQRADGLIFLTQYAKRNICAQLKRPCRKTQIVPHGISKEFFLPPRKQKSLTYYSNCNPIRLLYVSIVELYKHQWNVVKAIASLKAAGYPVALDLVGPAYPHALIHLRQVIRKADAEQNFIHYRGPIHHAALSKHYHQADAFIFASSCENMPNILLEAMAAGLPIACSNRGPMPEILSKAGIYFDPECPNQIVDALKTLLNNPPLRARLAQMAHDRAREYSWERCAKVTFAFLADVAKKNYRSR